MYKTIIVNPPKHFYFLISTFISVSQGRVSQRYLGMTAAMTQIPVPTANSEKVEKLLLAVSFECKPSWLM